MRMLVCSNDGRIEGDPFPIDLALKSLKHLAPDAGFAPAAKARVDRVPRPKFFRKVPPGATRSHLPEHALDHEPVVLGIWCLQEVAGGQDCPTSR